ncbi:MAG: YebC/PmpR family DNA-binding transcriptional regulator, partial [Pseudomonadales bacterium]|nr:YebC/PmpR family DNA-binding transcriptional regulator [Pseudomonadales bacterium]
EGYGPGGVAVLVETMTDNVNRTVAEVRHVFSKAGGNLGTNGSVAYMFTRRGEIAFPKGVDEDALMEQALELGAEDILVHDDGSTDVITAFETFGSVLDGLKAAGFTPAGAEVTMAAENMMDMDAEMAEKVMRFIDALEDLDDVQNVYSNANFTEALMEQLAG